MVKRTKLRQTWKRLFAKFIDREQFSSDASFTIPFLTVNNNVVNNLTKIVAIHSRLLLALQLSIQKFIIDSNIYLVHVNIFFFRLSYILWLANVNILSESLGVKGCLKKSNPFHHDQILHVVIIVIFLCLFFLSSDIRHCAVRIPGYSSNPVRLPTFNFTFPFHFKFALMLVILCQKFIIKQAPI